MELDAAMTTVPFMAYCMMTLNPIPCKALRTYLNPSQLAQPRILLFNVDPGGLSLAKSCGDREGASGDTPKGFVQSRGAREVEPYE